jgi:hypothetical protein
MANILVRSPRFESVTVPSSMNSVELELSIDGVLVYEIIKNGSAGTVITFEIAELIRDYINQTFNGTYVAATASVSYIFRYWSLPDGQGGGYNSTAVTHVAYNGYGTFMQGSNPTLSNPIWMVSKDVIKNGYYIYYPYNTVAKIPIIDNSDTVGFITTSTTDVTASLTGSSDVMNIVRIDCTKYGDGKKITFLNRFGALQDIWFFLKSVKTTGSSKQSYNANTISDSTGTATYSVNAPTKKVYSKTAKQTISLSSGYYPEGANPYFEELLLSDQIWLTQPDPYDPSTEQVVPVIVSNSSFTYKTSLNDKLIDYTMTFEMAFDYINNVR